MEMIQCASREEVWGTRIVRSASDAPSPREPDTFRSRWPLTRSQDQASPRLISPLNMLCGELHKPATRCLHPPPESLPRPSSPALAAQTAPSVLRQDSLGIAQTFQYGDVPFAAAASLRGMQGWGLPGRGSCLEHALPGT